MARRGHIDRRRRAALASLAVIACVGLAACGAERRDTPAATTPPAVAEAITADPAGVARATMIMVHAGGWLGHDAHAQRVLMDIPGQLLLKRSWRVVSIDYAAGTDGLGDVLDTVRAEVKRKTSNGPLCLYGESSGGHLALVAAARLGGTIDCVIGLGTPADLKAFEAYAPGGTREQRIVDAQMRKVFGTSAAELAPWDPVVLAPSIDADVLLMREADDSVVEASQSASFAAAHPSTRRVTLEAGDPTDVSTHFVHGTLSGNGRAEYDAAIASFADRARRRHRR